MGQCEDKAGLCVYPPQELSDHSAERDASLQLFTVDNELKAKKEKCIPVVDIRLYVHGRPRGWMPEWHWWIMCKSRFSLLAFLPLCLADTEEAFYHFSFLSSKRPKNLISMQNASQTLSIQSRALTIQTAYVLVCVSSLRHCVWRQTMTGRENPFVLFLWIPKVTFRHW